MGKKKSNISKNANWFVTERVLMIISLSMFIFVMIGYFREQALMFLALFVGFSLGSIALDLHIYKLRSQELKSEDPNQKCVYHPNLQIWGIGLILGIGSIIIYLFSNIITTIKIISINEVLKELNQINTNYFTASIVRHWFSVLFTYNFALLSYMGNCENIPIHLIKVRIPKP